MPYAASLDHKINAPIVPLRFLSAATRGVNTNAIEVIALTTTSDYDRTLAAGQVDSGEAKNLRAFTSLWCRHRH